MDNELIKLISIITIPTITIVGSNIALFMNLNKKIDNINDRITKLEIETKIGFEKINSKLDGKEIQITTTNKRIDKLETDFKEQRTEFKELINKVLDVLPKAAL